MRPALRVLLLAVVGVSLVVSPTVGVRPTEAVHAAPALVTHGSTMSAAPLPDNGPDPAARAWNTTLATTTPLTSPPPDSALIATPPPAVPDTTPVVMYFANSSTNCCVEANFTAPTGTWDMIVLNYTGQAVNGVYDSSYRAYIDESMVLFGTTPEYGTWTALKDITEYTSLFHGTFNLTFLLGAAVTNGYFLTSVSIAFYPAPSGGHAPLEPNLIVPLWFRVSITTSNPTIYVDTVVPTNVTNATMELYAYGFGPDEFWYSEEPGYRNLEVSVDGTPIASVLPFQYINTGGIDLFTWRPITGAFTLDDRPYELNETAALGLLEGSHNLTARIQGVTASSDWIVAGSLLLQTSAQATPATSTSYSWSAPAPVIHSGTGSYTETAAVTYLYSSLVGLPSGAINVSLSRTLTYSSTVVQQQTWLTATWNNLTATEISATNVTSAYPAGPVYQEVTTVFPIVMDIGDAFNKSSSGNNYPIYGNFTDYLDNVQQEWDETNELSGPTIADAFFQQIVNLDSATTNIYSGEEELTSANAALLLGITYVQSQTTQLYGQRTTAYSGGGSYNHLLEGSDVQPNGPYQAETVLVNAASSPMVVTVVASAPTADVGGPVTFTAEVSGGVAPYRFSWDGIPAGCSSVNSPQLTCRPSAAGPWPVGVSVTDASGEISAPASALVQVNPDPAVSLSASPAITDVGGSITFLATVTGGSSPVTCQWSTNGTQSGGPSSCGDPFVLTRSSPTTVLVNVTATDSVGIVAGPALGMRAQFTALPTLALSPPANVTPLVGHPVTLEAVATAGSGGYQFTWTLNGTVIAGATGASYTFVALGTGNYTLGAIVTDASGQSGLSAPVTLEALAGPSGHSTSPPPSGGSGAVGTSGIPPVAYVILGIAIGAVFGVVLMWLAKPTPRAPPRRHPPARPPET